MKKLLFLSALIVCAFACCPCATRPGVPGDSSLGPWQATSPMVMSRSSLAAVTVGDCIYALGGISSADHSVEWARVNTDGSLGSWQVTTSMVSRSGGLAAVSVGDYVYALGGHGDSAVDRSKVNTDGSLGPWEIVSHMTTRRGDLGAVVVGGHIYAVGGEASSGRLNSVERAKVNTDGSLGPWEVVSSMNVPRRNFAVVAVGNYIYAIGGVGKGVEMSVERATIYTDGSLGPWEFVTPMTTPRYGLAAVAANGYVYAIGGNVDASGTPTSSIERARVNTDGSLGRWEPMNQMVRSRSWLAAVRVNSHIYALGGEGGGRVERAEIMYK